MIKELRIGNWVDVKYVYSKTGRAFEQVEIIDSTWPGINNTILDGCRDLFSEDVQGIPLTPEILEKTGFDKCNQAPGAYEKDSVALFRDEVGFYHINDVFSTHIDFVHILQNWWFYNTTEELNIAL